MTPPSAVAGTAGTTLPRRRSGAPRTAPPRSAPPRSRQGRAGTDAPARSPRPAPPRTPAPARVVRGILDAPLLDRLVRGSGWIPLVAAGLMGIVFMQVSMLKLNAGIGNAVQTAATLERQNFELRNQVSRLEGNERIEGAARKDGMVVPAAGSFRYVTVRPGRTDAREAARGITTPSPVQPGSSQAAQQTSTAQGATTPVTPVTQPTQPTTPTTATPSATTPPTATQPATAAPAAVTPPVPGATG